MENSKSNNALMMVIIALITSALGAYGVYALLIKPDLESTKDAQVKEIAARAEQAKQELEANRKAQTETLKKELQDEVTQATSAMQTRADEVWQGEAARKAFASGIAQASAAKVAIVENFLNTGMLCADNAACGLKGSEGYKDEALNGMTIKDGVITVNYSDRFEKPAPLVRLTPKASMEDGSVSWTCETNAVAMLPPDIGCSELR
jgi:hypothetical protein